MGRTAKKKIAIKDEGVTLIDDVDSIDFSGAGITGTAVGNDVTETVGATGVSQLTATGTVDDSNTAFTFASKPSIVVVNGASYRENKGWTWAALTLTVTLDSPVGDGGDIYGIS